MKVLVTGSSGYVGKFLVPILKQKGWYVIGIDRNLSATSLEDEFVQTDLLNKENVKNIVNSDIDLIIHLAAAKSDWGLSDEEFYRDNKEVTNVLLKTAEEAGVMNHVFYSTVAVYGPSNESKAEDAEYSPTIAYGSSKMECEKAYFQFQKRNKEAKIKIIRPSVIFGPEHPESTNIYRLIDAIYNNRFFMIGGGQAFKTTSYIYNLMDATEFILDRMNIPGIEDFIYVDQPVIQTKRLVNYIYNSLGLKGKPKNLPLNIIKPVARIFDLLAEITGKDLPITAARIEKFCTSTNFSSNKIFNLGFKQNISNEEAIHETVNWQLSHVYGEKKVSESNREYIRG